MFRWVENMLLEEKTNITGRDSLLAHFDQNFGHNILTKKSLQCLSSKQKETQS